MNKGNKHYKHVIDVLRDISTDELNEINKKHPRANTLKQRYFNEIERKCNEFLRKTEKNKLLRCEILSDEKEHITISLFEFVAGAYARVTNK